MFWKRVEMCVEIVAFITYAAIGVINCIDGAFRLAVTHFGVVAWIVMSFLNGRDCVTYNRITRHALDGWRKCVEQLGSTSDRAARHLGKYMKLQKTVRRTAHAMKENAELRRRIRRIEAILEEAVRDSNINPKCWFYQELEKEVR